MSIMGVIFLVVPEPIVKIFSSDPEVIELATVCLRLVAIAQPALATWMIIAGGLRGAGDTRNLEDRNCWFCFCQGRLGLSLGNLPWLGARWCLGGDGCRPLCQRLSHSKAIQSG